MVLAAAGATEKVAKGLYGLQSFPATGFEVGFDSKDASMAGHLVSAHLSCGMQTGNILQGRINNLTEEEFTASQMSSLALINLFINSIIIY